MAGYAEYIGLHKNYDAVNFFLTDFFPHKIQVWKALAKTAQPQTQNEIQIIQVRHNVHSKWWTVVDTTFKKWMKICCGRWTLPHMQAYSYSSSFYRRGSLWTKTVKNSSFNSHPNFSPSVIHWVPGESYWTRVWQGGVLISLRRRVEHITEWWLLHGRSTRNQYEIILQLRLAGVRPATTHNCQCWLENKARIFFFSCRNFMWEWNIVRVLK